LADFQQHSGEFEALGVPVVALSADNAENARGTVAKLGLSFPVLYDLDPEQTSRAIGCYVGVREGRAHLQPADFVLTPDGNVAHAVYSSGKVGRLTAEDALTVVRDLQKKQPAGAAPSAR